MSDSKENFQQGVVHIVQYQVSVDSSLIYWWAEEALLSKLRHLIMLPEMHGMRLS